MEIHNIEPVYNEKSRILILGSFPSVKSREVEFFYAHPQNRFWRVLARLCECACPEGIEEKKKFLLKHHIALWDVIQSCEIKGSSDSSITNAEVNDLSRIFNSADIQAVFANGGTAFRLYKRYIGKDITLLPSTSPANAAWSEDRLCDAWRIICEYL